MEMVKQRNVAIQVELKEDSSYQTLEFGVYGERDKSLAGKPRLNTIMPNLLEGEARRKEIMKNLLVLSSEACSTLFLSHPV
jgi:hypothetical protein